jgi:hypothetical protein
MANQQALQDFVDYVKKLNGDEKGEAQLFCDRLFRAFGHGGIIEANGQLEARIKFNSTGRTKFADCLWSPADREGDGVLIEMKKRAEKSLENHFPQVRDYWVEMNPEKVIGPGAQKPKYIILCNFDRFLIYRHLSLVDDIPIEHFVDRATAFNFMLPDPKEPIFHNNAEEISREAAGVIGELFKYLIFDLQGNREQVQRFLLQCVLALFSEDFNLLPDKIFSEIVHECLYKRQSSYDLLGGLFRQMASEKRATGGRFKEVRFFNGGLFDAVEPLELDPKSLRLLEKATQFNWKGVNPAIFGALFESTMNEQERHQFGAHFTSEVDIQKIVNPTIVRHWKKRLQKANTLQELSRLLDELSQFKVLDPSCGCGNFLYVAYHALKDIEMEIVEKIVENFPGRSAKNIQLNISRISTKQFYGIDILPIAVEIARVTMMLAKELAADKWNKRISPALSMLGMGLDEGLPLDHLDENIICADALLCEWPAFDAVIGNPPYQSKNKIAFELNRTYINQVRKKYPDVPGRADYCVYWFRRTHDEMKPGQRAGLVGTNTIRQNYSREGGLDYIVDNGGTITDAVSTQAWSGEASVHVSIVNWVKGEEKGPHWLAFQRGAKEDVPFVYYELEKINSALSLALDVRKAKSLVNNRKPKLCFQGQTQGHKGFLIKRTEAQLLISINPTYQEVLFPFLIGNELVGNINSIPKRYVIDFRKHDIFSVQQYGELFQKVKQAVYADRHAKAQKEEENNQQTLTADPQGKVNHHHVNFFKHWWQLDYVRNELMDLLESLPRYCACSRVTKRPIFEFISPEIHPGDALTVFLLPDDYSFGLLQSTVHWEWFNARCSTNTERPRYTSNTVFDTFPWPQKPVKKQVQEIAKRAVELRAVRNKVMRENHWSLRDLYRIMEETPSNPVSVAQEKLDTAVMSAYGMGKNEDILAFLLALNLELAEKEARGEKIVGPGLPPVVDNPAEFITADCVQMRK